MAATRHYPIRPKSDLVLLCGLANLLIASGWAQRKWIDEHTRGFGEFTDFVTRFTCDAVCAQTGLRPEEFLELGQMIGEGKRVSLWWTMGVNQGHESTLTAQAIINLALLTGSIGRPGTGANSITGQCNAMGSRLYSNITSLIGGHDFRNAVDRKKVADVLGIDEGVIPQRSSMAYDQIVDAIGDGKIGALWVIATNSSHSWIHQRGFNKILRKFDFLVVQDLYPTTETARRADLYLPAAGWGEKEGTLINSERRIGLIKKVRRAPGQALSDFHIFQLIADYWGCGAMFSKWTSPKAAFHLLKEISRGQPCDITGIRDFAMLDACGGIQWPLPEGAAEPPEPQRRLFEDGRFFTGDGRARFVCGEPREMGEQPDDAYPFLLLTGRGTSAQWHTNTRTEKSAILRRLYPERCWMEIHPEDAARLQIHSHEEVRVSSRRGSLTASAFVTPTIQTGLVFIPMHYPEVNSLTFPEFDPSSRQPSYKACAVAVAPAGVLRTLR